jgi:NAD(P)-dependent dehydrogenase (short-subunit alcohol dehydrogenase family)
MKDKSIVIISGGAGVLGQSYAKRLTEDGFGILLLDVQETPRDGLVGEYLKCEISIEEDIKKLEAHLASKQSVIAGIINNASPQPPGFTKELEEYSTETFRKVIEVNLLGSFMLLRAVIPFMKKQGFGSIINIGSIQAVVAPTFQIYEGMGITSPLSYSVAKAGLVHSCKWLAAKYGKYNIRANAISPGGLGDSQRGGSEFEKVYSSRTPLGRMAFSDEIAELVSYLISDRSAYITGQNIVIDGGWTIY